MPEQGIDQSSVGIARRRMHDKPRGLIDNDEIGILVHDHERYVLGNRRSRCWRRNGNFVDFPAFDPRIRVSYRRPGAKNGAGGDQLLQTRAAELGKRLGQEPIQTRAGLPVRDIRVLQRSI